MVTLNFSEAKQTGVGGQVVDITNESNKRYKIKTPIVHLPFGVNAYENDKYTSYSLEASLRNTTGMSEFLDTLEAIEETVKTTAYDRCKEWFKKQVTTKIINDLYKPFVKKSGNYPPQIRMKLQAKDVHVYDCDKNAISFLDISKKSKAKLVIELNNVYFGNTNFSCIWRVVEVELQKEEVDPLSTYAFIDD